MNAAVFMLTSALSPVDCQTPAPVAAPACGTCAPAAEACDPCAKTKFLDKIKGRFSSMSFPKLGHSHGCDSCAAPTPSCEPCAKPAPVVCVKPSCIVAAPACGECSSCGSAKPSIFASIKGRLGCHKAVEATCDTCGTAAPAAPVAYAPAAPCAGAVTTIPPSAPTVVTPAPIPVAPMTPVAPKVMPKEAPKAPVVPVAPIPAKVGLGNGPTITPVSNSSTASPF